MTAVRRRPRLSPPREATPSEIRAMARRKRDAEIDMSAFDRLPPALRRAIAHGALGANSGGMLNDLEQLHLRYGLSRAYMASFMAENLPLVEDNTILAFGSDYQRKFGTPLPHLAAGVSVLRPKEGSLP